MIFILLFPGKDIKVKELREAYDAVVLAYGAAKDRTLNIKGENSYNVISARNFVGYYNGLPECVNLDFSLDCEKAVIIGLGNVAIDVARVLLTPIDDLKVSTAKDWYFGYFGYKNNELC